MKRTLIIAGMAVILCFAMVGDAKASLFSIWADTDSDGFKDVVLGHIFGYEGTIGGNANYNYSSFSGHPVNGPNPQAHRLKIFLYERTTNNRDFLNIIGGRDNAGHSGHHHSFSLTVDEVLGSTLNPHVVRGDEGHEFLETSADHFEGDWRFRRNSDGGVIGGLRGDWEARITFGDSNLNRHGFYSSNGDHIFIDQLDYDHYFISTEVVPEPASILLFTTGMAGAFFRRRIG